MSKKFLGEKTPKEIQDRILDILFTWTDKYSELGKIKEAYTMLRSQGILHEPQKNVITKSSKKSTDSTLKLMESEKFKRLLQSKNQKDIEAANLMIQNMVRDNDRRSQIQNRRLMDLQSANENSILLKQMLDEHDPSETSEDMLSTLQEIYNHCVKLRPTVARLAEEAYDSELFTTKIQETSEAINTAIELYTAIVINKSIVPTKKTPQKDAVKSTNLLDVAEVVEQVKIEQTGNLSELNDIFSSPQSSGSSSQIQHDSILLTPHVMQPQTNTANNNIDIMALINKHKQNNDDLLKNFNAASSIQNTTPVISNNKNHGSEKSKPLSELDSIISGMKTKLLVADGEIERFERKDSEDDVENLISGDEVILKLVEAPPKVEEIVIQSEAKIALKDINLDMADIQPSEIEAPRTIFDEKKGLKILVNFAQGHPAKDVVVLVVTVINQGPISIDNFQFEACVAKPCRLRVLDASNNKLPAVKPFKPPTETIDQVLLLLNPTQKPINMVAILTYNLQDDPDPYKESIEVKDIPYDS